MYAAAFSLAILLGTAPARANPTNSNEASLGAAAIVVLSQKCAPQRVGHYESEAHTHLNFMLQQYSQEAKKKIFDELKMKIRALQISASTDSCAGAARLHSMATHWGYAHLLQTMVAGQ